MIRMAWRFILTWFTPLEKLRAMDNVVGLAAGAQKVEAIRAVLRGGYLDVLITDEPTAALLLKGE